MTMDTKEIKTSNVSQVLLWFGAAVSISELMTGALIAPLGLEQGILAILIGHVIGALILFPAGLIGAESGLSWAESTRISFSKYGSAGFSVVNILQLLGWTAVMILSGAKAFDSISAQLWNYQNEQLWCIIIGLLICLWIFIGLKNLSKLNVIVITLLFICTIVLGITIFSTSHSVAATDDTITFGAAVELNIAMALSWLPLISDYTRTLKRPFSGTVASVLSYFIGSLLMFTIGLGAAVNYGTSNVFTIMTSAGLGLASLATIVLSTVTTTFLDVYSAGVSSVNISAKIHQKAAAAGVCILAVIIAIMIPLSRYEDFLYLISSVFAPLFAVTFTDYFLLHQRKIRPQNSLNIRNLILWLGGFFAYRLLISHNTVIGITLPVMLGLVAVSYICGIAERKTHEQKI